MEGADEFSSVTQTTTQSQFPGTCRGCALVLSWMEFPQDAPPLTETSTTEEVQDFLRNVDLPEGVDRNQIVDALGFLGGNEFINLSANDMQILLVGVNRANRVVFQFQKELEKCKYGFHVCLHTTRYNIC